MEWRTQTSAVVLIGGAIMGIFGMRLLARIKRPPVQLSDKRKQLVNSAFKHS